MSVVRLTLIVVGTAAYLGLAMVGWGGLPPFFSHPALIALAIALFAMAGVAAFAGGNISPGEREDRANRWVLVAFTVIGLLDAYLPAYTDCKEFWTIGGEAVRWVSVVLFTRVARCESGQSLCSASGSAAWSLFSPAIRWSPAVSIVSSATPAIRDC